MSGAWTDPRQKVVHGAHAQNVGKPSAYLDETLRGFEYANEAPFYVVTAVVVEWDDMIHIRERLVEIADGHYWHTNKAWRTDKGQERTREMLSYLADGIEPCVVAIQHDVKTKDTDLESARKDCLDRLLRALQKGGESWSPVNLAIMEERQDQAHKNRDDRTYRNLLKSGALSRRFRLLQTSPAMECLLWLPDVVSYAIRRDLALGEGELRAIVEDNITVIT